MHAPHAPKSQSIADTQKARHGADHLALDCAGENFYAIDRGLRDLVRLYLAPDDFSGWSRTSIVWVRWRAAGSMNWRAPPTSIRRC